LQIDVCVWNYTPLEVYGLRVNLAKKFFRKSLSTLGIDPRWLCGFTRSSMASLHLKLLYEWHCYLWFPVFWLELYNS